MSDREYVDILRTLSDAELDLCSPSLRSKAIGLQSALGRRSPQLGGWTKTVKEGGPGKTPKGRTPGARYGVDKPAVDVETPLWMSHCGAWISVSAEAAVLGTAQGRTVRMMTLKEMQEAGCIHG